MLYDRFRCFHIRVCDTYLSVMRCDGEEKRREEDVNT